MVTHAHATHATVALNRIGDELELRISDDGVGFTPRVDDAVRAGHIGPALLTSRAEAVAGTLRFSPVEIGSEACLRVEAEQVCLGVQPQLGNSRSEVQDARGPRRGARLHHATAVGRSLVIVTAATSPPRHRSASPSRASPAPSPAGLASRIPQRILGRGFALLVVGVAGYAPVRRVPRWSAGRELSPPPVSANTLRTRK